MSFISTTSKKSWYRNHNKKKISSKSWISRKSPRRSPRLASIAPTKQFKYPPQCRSVSTSQSSIDSNVTYKCTKKINQAVKYIPNYASFKEYAVSKFLYFRYNARITKYQYLADWKGFDETQRSFTEHIDDCAEAVADFHILRFKKRLIESEEARIENIKTSNALMIHESENSYFGDDEAPSIVSESEKSEISNPMLPPKIKLKRTDKEEADDAIAPPKKPISKKLIKKKKSLWNRKTNIKKE